MLLGKRPSTVSNENKAEYNDSIAFLYWLSWVSCDKCRISTTIDPTSERNTRWTELVLPVLGITIGYLMRWLKAIIIIIIIIIIIEEEEEEEEK